MLSRFRGRNTNKFILSVNFISSINGWPTPQHSVHEISSSNVLLILFLVGHTMWRIWLRAAAGKSWQELLKVVRHRPKCYNAKATVLRAAEWKSKAFGSRSTGLNIAELKETHALDETNSRSSLAMQCRCRSANHAEELRSQKVRRYRQVDGMVETPVYCSLGLDSQSPQDLSHSVVYYRPCRTWRIFHEALHL